MNGGKYLTTHGMYFNFTMPEGKQSKYTCNLGVFTYLGIHFE